MSEIWVAADSVALLIETGRGVQIMRRHILSFIATLAALLAFQTAAATQSRIGQATTVKPKAHTPMLGSFPQAPMFKRTKRFAQEATAWVLWLVAPAPTRRTCSRTTNVAFRQALTDHYRSHIPSLYSQDRARAAIITSVGTFRARLTGTTDRLQFGWTTFN
jgi:ABC-type xylose transport system permease subunit